MGVVQLDHYKQYKQFNSNQHLDLSKDTVLIHNKQNQDLARTYTAAWVKLLTENANKNN